MGRKSKSGKKNVKSVERKSFLQATKEYFKEVIAELYKITWPSYEEVKQGTIVVFFVVIVVATFLALVDVVVSKIFKFFVL